MRILITTLVFSFLTYAFIFVNQGTSDFNYEKLGEELKKVESKEDTPVDSLAHAFKKINKKMETVKKKTIKKKVTNKIEIDDPLLKQVAIMAKQEITKAIAGEEISGEKIEMLKGAFREIDDPVKQKQMAEAILDSLPTQSLLNMRSFFWSVVGDVIKDKQYLQDEIYQDLISTLSAEIPEEDPDGMMTKSMMFSSFVGLGKTQEVFDKSIEVIKLEKSNEVKKILLAQLQQQFPEKLKGKEPKDF